MNPYLFVDFCEHDACTKRLASVGLAQTCPNEQLQLGNY